MGVARIYKVFSAYPSSALAEPAKQTTIVVVRRGTLASEADVKVWVAEHERRFLEAVRTGPVIVS